MRKTLSPATRARPLATLPRVLWARLKLAIVARFFPAQLPRVIAEGKALIAELRGQNR